jgi:hypothetical protein
MWSQEAREAFALFMAMLEANFLKVIDHVEEFIAAYYAYILIGLIILVILITLDQVWKRQDKRRKKKIDDQIAEQMKVRMKENNDENL